MQNPQALPLSVCTSEVLDRQSMGLAGLCPSQEKGGQPCPSLLAAHCGCQHNTSGAGEVCWRHLPGLCISISRLLHPLHSPPSEIWLCKHEIQSTRVSGPFLSLLSLFQLCSVLSHSFLCHCFWMVFPLPGWHHPFAVPPGPWLLWPADVPVR